MKKVSSSTVRGNFTLVELLVVIAIMGILMFIGLPAFEKLAKGSGTELAARNLTSKLGQARGYAVTIREYVAVLMPTTAAEGASSAKLPNDYIFRGYKLCVVSSTSTAGEFTFKRWLPSEKWEFMPTGTAINHINDAPHALGSDSDSTTGTWTTTAVTDKVDGVILSEIGTPKYDTVDNVRAIVFKPAGKMAVNGNRCVAVSESTYSGTTLTSTNNKNWIDITVDQFTGRVAYGSE